VNVVCEDAFQMPGDCVFYHVVIYWNSSTFREQLPLRRASSSCVGLGGGDLLHVVRGFGNVRACANVLNECFPILQGLY
jgi:hypothetical protein